MRNRLEQRRFISPLWALILALLVSACASLDSSPGQAGAADDLNKDLAQLKFRGRWWNHYDRAVVYMQHDQFEEARADLTTALSKRSRDQRWARTYGLHFAPEYFPNRELGIAYFLQDRPADALGYLEKSISDFPTARAAYYLELAREQFVSQQGLDSEPPAIELMSPAPGRVYAKTFIDVVVRATDDTYVRAVSINGEPVTVRLSDSSLDVTSSIRLSSGSNPVTIAATDIAGKTSELRTEVLADLEGPAVSFTERVAGSRDIEGLIADASQIAYMRIDGRPAALEPAGGVVRFGLAAGPEFLPDTAEFECADVLGNVTRGVAGGRSQALARPFGRVRERVHIAHAGAVVLAALVDDGTGAGTAGPLDTPEIAFTNLRDGQRYLQPEIVVGLHIRSGSPIAEVELNGARIEHLLPTRRVQQITSRVPLDSVGTHEILAEVSDLDGKSSNVAVSIERAYPQVYQISNRLSVALVGNLWRDPGGGPAELATFLADELPRELGNIDRFQVIERDNIGEVIAEQELVAALASPDDRKRLGRLSIADYLLVADTRRFGENLEILLHVVDPFTGRDDILDVYGPATSIEQLRRLVADLALRLYQEFPRVQGQILAVTANGRRVRTDIQQRDRVREAMKCLLYRESEVVDTQTGQSLGTDLIPVATGTFTSVKASRSTIALEPAPTETQPQNTDLVITR